MDHQEPFAWNRLVALGGIAWVLLVVAVIFIKGGQVPPTTAHGAEDIAAWYAEHHRTVAASTLVQSGAALAILVFVAGLWGVVHGVPGASGVFGVVGLVSGVGFVVSSLLYTALQAGAADLAEHGAGATAVAALHGGAEALSPSINLLFGLCVAAFALLMLTTRLVGRWLGMVGLLSGIALLATGGRLLTAHVAFDVLDGIGALLFNVWLLATSITALRHARSGVRAPAVRAQVAQA